MSHREKQLKKSAVRVVESDLGVIDLPYLLLTLLLALAINLFIVPQHLYSSGLLGLCQVIRTLLAL